MDYRYEFNGKKASLLGYGAMRMPEDQEELELQVKRLLDGGVTYFDTSPVYMQATSERRLGEALAKSGYRREDYVLVTKLSNFAESHWTLEKCREMFAASLKALRTDYFDGYLLHSIGNGGFKTFSKRYLENGVLDWLEEERRKGTIRNLGFSFHNDPKALEWCLKAHDEGRHKWDFALIQLNFVDWRHAEETAKGKNLNAEYLYNELYRRGIRVTVMEPLLGGRLAKYDYAIARHTVKLDPEATQASWALRFCASHPGVACVISGMSKLEHIEENLGTFSPFKPLTAAEFEALERAAVDFVKRTYTPCNRCNYCMPCPYGLDIPALLTFRNEWLVGREGRSGRDILKAYERAVGEPLRRADHCTGCDRCRKHCPQQIDIAREIEAIADAIEELSCGE